MQEKNNQPAAGATEPRRKGPYQLGPWTVWSDRLTLRSEHEEHRLEPKVMAVLDCLARHAPEVVTKDQLVDEVWGRAFVSDEVIARCISVLRQRLGDDHRQPTYIETIPKTGYRMIVAPAWVDLSAQPLTGAGPSFKVPLVYRRNKSNAVLAGVGVVVAITLALMWQGLMTRPYRDVIQGPVSLAVLPFANLGGDPDNEYFSDGLSEEILNALARREELKVVSRTSSFALKGTSEDARKIGNRLGVRYLLEGSVRRNAQTLRISAQLIDTDTGLDVWSEHYSGNLVDTFAVQNDVSTAIVRALLPKLASSDAVAMDRQLVPDYQVYDQYLQALFHLNRRTEEHLGRAVELLQAVVKEDPGYGPAWRQLASAYALLPSYSDRGHQELFDRALRALDEGERLSNSQLVGADTVRAYIALKTWDWGAAREYFDRAARASPNDANLFQWRSQFQASTGQLEASLADALKARTLDTLAPVVNDRLAIAYLWLDRNDEAAAAFRRASELGMQTGVHAESQLLVLARQGHFDEAARAAQGLLGRLGLDSTWVPALMQALADPAHRPSAVQALARAAADAQVPPNVLLVAWAMLGETDRAMELAYALADHPALMEVEMLFAGELQGVRQHPGFAGLLEHLGLISYWDAYGWPAQCRREPSGITCR